MNKPKIQISNVKEIKTTAVGTLIIILSCLDLWHFKEITALVFGFPVQVLGIIFGVALWLIPDAILSFGRRKAKEL